jgi:hypothetical protein
MMVKVLILIITVVLNIFLAKIDSNKIKENRQIYHGINSMQYLIFLTACFFITGSVFLIIGCAIIRMPIFNTSLNYFRGLSLEHTSKTTTSIIDQITNPVIKKIGYWNYNITLVIISIILILL